MVNWLVREEAERLASHLEASALLTLLHQRHDETSLNRRLTCHLTSDTPKQHTLQVHGEKLTCTMLADNTIILAQASTNNVFNT
jgi:hypothetical protein